MSRQARARPASPAQVNGRACCRRENEPEGNREGNAMIQNFLRDESGLELSEYAVAAALIALAVVGVFTTLGTNISGVVNNLATFIKN
jgi:pilus assembly protein Flp/PilA